MKLVCFQVTEKVEEPPELYLPTTLSAIETAYDETPSYLSKKSLVELEFVDTGFKLANAAKSDEMELSRIQDSHLKEISDDGEMSAYDIFE